MTGIEESVSGSGVSRKGGATEHSAGHGARRAVMTTASVFVGREGELAAVREALEMPPALVMIDGEPGIGKTRLLHEALGAYDTRAALLAVCPPLTAPFPLGPIVHGLRGFGGVASGVELSPLGGVLHPLFPEWTDWLPPAPAPADDPSETRHRLFRALIELVERLDVGFLVVEDAHWADSATLEWLLTLTSAPLRDMSIVVTFRPTDVPGDSLLWRLTSRSPTGMSRVRVGLEPLNVEQTRELVGSMFGAEEVSEQFAVFLHERADGIPLAIEESVRLLRDRHDIVRHEGRWTRRLLDELKVPPTVRDSVLERISRLPLEAQRVLDAAAVLAEPADETQLAAVAGLDGTQIDSGVASALTSGLLRESEPGRFGFRHALDAQAVDDAIPASQRRRLHGRTVDVLRTLRPEPVVRLARHCREAGDIEAWRHYAEASAGLARKSGDDRTAAVTLLEVLTAVTHSPDRAARLARRLGELAPSGTAAFGIPDSRVEEALRNVVNRADLSPSDRGEIRLLLGRMLHTVSKARQLAIDEFVAAIPDLGHRPDLACSAMIMLATSQTPDMPAEWHLEWLKSATALSDQIESPLDRRWFAVMRASALIVLGEESGWIAAAELPDSGATRGEQRVAAVGHLNVGQCANTWGRYEEARLRLGKASEIIEASGLGQMRNNARVGKAYVDWYTGAWGGLLDTAMALAEAEESEHLQKLEARQLVGLLELARGERANAEAGLRDVTDQYRRSGAAEPIASLAPAALARLHLVDGAFADAIATTSPVVEMIVSKAVWPWSGDILSVHTAALVAAGRPDDAAVVLRQFADGLVGGDAPAPVAALLVGQAILTEAKGETGLAVDMFAEAAAAWAALPRPYDELLTYERQGLSLLAADERASGLEVLTKVEERLRQLGARWDADRVARRLREHGVEVSRGWKRGPRGYGDQLSPRELEVLTRVAEGMTNREVGQVLFLSPRTVAAHLSTAMHKLGVSSRTAAAMVATEAGLIAAESHEQATSEPDSGN